MPGLSQMPGTEKGSLMEYRINAYSLPKQAIIVVIKEDAPDNVGVGDELIIDEYPLRSE